MCSSDLLWVPSGVHALKRHNPPRSEQRAAPPPTATANHANHERTAARQSRTKRTNKRPSQKMRQHNCSKNLLTDTKNFESLREQQSVYGQGSDRTDRAQPKHGTTTITHLRGATGRGQRKGPHAREKQWEHQRNHNSTIDDTENLVDTQGQGRGGMDNSGLAWLLACGCGGASLEGRGFELDDARGRHLGVRHRRERRLVVAAARQSQKCTMSMQGAVGARDGLTCKCACTPGRPPWR